MKTNADFIQVALSTRRITSYLTISILVLIAFSLAGQIGYHEYGLDGWHIELFDVNQEFNIPTWFSGALLLCTALLLWVSSAVTPIRSIRHTWQSLSIIFVFLSLDEIASLHELLGLYLREYFNATGIWFYSWVIVGIPLVIFLTIVYWRFVFHLPPRIRNLSIIAAFVFVSGSIGVEMISAGHAVVHGQNNLTFVFYATVEELFEMLGVTIFISALLNYLSFQKKAIAVQFTHE